MRQRKKHCLSNFCLYFERKTNAPHSRVDRKLKKMSPDMAAKNKAVCLQVVLILKKYFNADLLAIYILVHLPPSLKPKPVILISQ